MSKGFGVLGLADGSLIRLAVNVHFSVICFPLGVTLSSFRDLQWVEWSFALWAEKHLNNVCQ